jgi:flavin reductase (DIM6/NTAB) family NADH-FMN oxidoreductase RutF
MDERGASSDVAIDYNVFRNEMDKIDIDPVSTDATSLYKIVTGTVVPRPIGLISTVDLQGRHNVAPFSFFNALSGKPAYVCVSIAVHGPEQRPKDSLRNIIDTGVFVANIVSEDMAQAQHLTGHPFDPNVDEFDVCGFTAVASKTVKAPSVGESKANLECEVFNILPLTDSTYTLVVGRVRHIRVAASILESNGRIDIDALAPVGRLVGNGYCRVRDTFTLDRSSLHETHPNLMPPKGS